MWGAGISYEAYYGLFFGIPLSSDAHRTRYTGLMPVQTSDVERRDACVLVKLIDRVGRSI